MLKRDMKRRRLEDGMGGVLDANELAVYSEPEQIERLVGLAKHRGENALDNSMAK